MEPTTGFTDIFYFIAVVGGTIALGAVIAFVMIRQRQSTKNKTPGELKSEGLKPDPGDADAKPTKQHPRH